MIVDNSEYTILKEQRIQQGSAIPSFGEKQDIEEHLAMLRQEFSGSSELEFLVASTIVHIRRDIRADAYFDQFSTIWSAHTDFLLERLSSRWLVSCCDTIADRSDDESEKTIAFSASLFMNTIKLYESERLAQSLVGPAPQPLKTSTIPELKRVPLFDGMTVFLIGRGELIQNLMQRLENLDPKNSLAASILKQLVARAQHFDTVFRRFKAIQKSE